MVRLFKHYRLCAQQTNLVQQDENKQEKAVLTCHMVTNKPMLS